MPTSCPSAGPNFDAFGIAEVTKDCAQKHLEMNSIAEIHVTEWTSVDSFATFGLMGPLHIVSIIGILVQPLQLFLHMVPLLPLACLDIGHSTAAVGFHCCICSNIYTL